jgi:hypothetical protein
MATVIEGYTTEEQRSVVLFCGQKYSMQRIFIKKCFLFMDGECLSRKSVHSWVGKRFAGDGKVEIEVRKSGRLLCCGFRRTGKEIHHPSHPDSLKFIYH